MKKTTHPVTHVVESRSCDVQIYVGLLVHIQKYLEVVHAKESLQITIHSQFTRVL
jgi:hypothetical protein